MVTYLLGSYSMQWEKRINTVNRRKDHLPLLNIEYSTEATIKLFIVDEHGRILMLVVLVYDNIGLLRKEFHYNLLPIRGFTKKNIQKSFLVPFELKYWEK